jgi:hypothetical protein
MLLGTELEHLEVTVVEVDRGVPGIAVAGDVLVGVRVRLRNFAGAAEAWVLREVWSDFLTRLRGLERDRRGEATLQSISPEELRVRLYAIDHAGHMALEGELTSYYGSAHRLEAASLKFGTIEFDPTTLPILLRELEIAAPPHERSHD